uniref:tRNA-dihydrouridine(47) synthase [NAD(P)(+)] n=2 Tax=Auxenochlorella protothecoides TaxID=3075 RepID=A0A1D2AA06_AUXPR
MGVPSRSPEELVAQGDAPVKPEFIRPGCDRVHIVQVQGSQGAGVVDGQQSLSRRQEKKARAKARHSTAALCTRFAQGTCSFKDNCRFNHDVRAFLNSKPPELPGQCPFHAQGSCPFGITCQWASKHSHPDPLTSEYLQQTPVAAAVTGLPVAPPLKTEDKNGVVTAEALAAALDGASAAVIPLLTPVDPTASQVEAARASAAATGFPEPSTPAEQDDVDGAAQAFWRGDGTIPMRPVALLPGPSIQSSINTMDKAVQNQLWHRRYDFSTADRVLSTLGLRNSRAGQGQGKQEEEEQEGKRPRTQGPDAGALPGEAVLAKAEPEAEPAAAQVLPTAKVEAEAQLCTVPAETAPGPGAELGIPVTEPETAAPAAAPPPQHPYLETAEHKRESSAQAIDFRGKLYLAPLTTVGNLPFRRLAKRLGADITCGEMALATNLLQGQASEWALLRRHPEEDCFGVQICGGYPDSMARCAQLIQDQCSVDFVDINFGCPIDAICSKGAGSACILRPARMESIVRSMSSVLQCPLTFKTRKAYNDGHDVAHTFVPGAAVWGASAVTLHGRTREQRYSRPADWPYIQNCAAATQAPLQLVGNGDILGWQDHYRHLEESGGRLATTYIARGALIKPWIFTEIKQRRDWDISAGERLDLLKLYCSFGLEHWGSDARGVESTRRFLLEWLSFQHRYIPVGLLDVLPQRMDWRVPVFVGRSDLETLLASDHAGDWVRISEMLLGPAPPGFTFTPKHKANAYSRRQEAGASSLMKDEEQENG